jgi:hypothetical protein
VSDLAPDPPPAVAPPVRRWVVLHHVGVPAPHFDLLLELRPGAPLASWRAPRWPLGDHAPLEAAVDHRALYLDYEGPVSGGRGEVRRVDGGALAALTVRDGLVEATLDDRRVLTLRRADAASWVGALTAAAAP